MKKFARILFLILNVLVVIAFLLTTTAVWIAPSHSVWPSLAAFGYPVTLAACVVFMLIWLCFGRWEFLVSVAAIALRWSLLPLFFQIGGNADMPEPSDDVLTVMAFNVHQFRGVDDDSESSPDGAREFLAMVEQEGPDVLCLQEFCAVKGVSISDSLRFMGYSERYSVRTSRTGIPYGTVLFSRLPIKYVSKINAASNFYADISKNGQIVRLMCVHLDSYQLNDSDREEIDRIAHGDVDSTSSLTIAKFTSTISKHEREWNDELRPVVEAASVPVILAGDLNDIPSSYLYHQLSRRLEDSFVECGKGMGATYCGRNFPAFRIDYVFHSADMECVAYKRIRSKVSDHNAVMSALKLNINDD